MEDPVIIDLPQTSTSDISQRLVRLRNEHGAMALGRVMTFVLVVDEDSAEDDRVDDRGVVHAPVPCDRDRARKPPWEGAS